MSWLLIFIIAIVLIAFSFSLWMRLTKVLDRSGVIYTNATKKRILWEILFQIARLIVLLLVVHCGLLLLQL